MKTLPVLSALLIIVVVVSLVPGLARGSAAADPLPPPQPSDPIESQRQSSQSTQAQVAAPDSMPGRVPIVLYASKGVAPFRIAPRLSPALRRAQHATFTINYIPAGTQNELGDDCLSWPAGSQAAFQYAADLWGALLSSSVPIKIDACWASLDEGVLGHSATDNFYRNFTGAPQANTWYSVALANALSGTDQNGNTAEMHIAYSDNGISWYFGTDGNPSMGQYDFVSVVLHEIAHGLNFAGSMWVDIPGYIGCGSVGWGCWGLGSSPPYYPVIYDRFAENGSGQALINTSLFPNPSTQLAAQLTGNNLYFNGTYANAANGGQPPKLYAPSTWRPGSSYAHLDYNTFHGTPNALMLWAIDDGTAIHDPGPITCGIFRDLGWQNPCASAPIVGIRKTVVGSDWKPGDRITFTLSIANTGAVAATSVVVTDIIPVQVLTPTYASSLLITPIGGSSFVWNVGTLGIGQSGVITIYGQIDPSLTSGWSFSNIAYISDPADTTPDNKSSRVTVGEVKVYLPVIMNRWPPIPDAPVLNAISNSDGDGNYSVTWNAAYLADTYTLQEDDNAAFSSPVTVYDHGDGTSWTASGKASGTYYYRVKATNSWGDSGWSNVQSTIVSPPQSVVYVQNNTGGQLCYEVYSTGIGQKCYSPGTYYYGTFPIGTYSWHASAPCGSASGSRYYGLGTVYHQFWCGTGVTLQSIVLLLQLDK